ncbi:carboxymuconolactone decarboxylase family protein [Mucilaginibacter sp. AW1-3]
MSALLKVPAKNEVAPEAQTTFDNLTKAMGKVPNLYATIGYSANALNSYMAYVQAQAKGSFHAKEREAIYLIVSQLNGCEYCLASHTASAMRFGWTEEETLALRAGTYQKGYWQLLYKVIRSVIENKGDVAKELLDEFFESGYTEKELMDLMVLINVMTFTNYTYRLTKIPIDFPLAKPI